MRPLTTFACVLALLVLVLAITAFIGPSFSPKAFCEPTELNCTRDWIGAFSGWAAAGLALAAALLALPPLRMQVAEAKKQTAFLLGDGDATLDLYPSQDIQDGGLFEIRLTNWNRRSLELKEIGVEIAGHGQFHAGVLTLTRDGEDVRFGNVIHADARHVIKFIEPVFIRGWENRAGPPTSVVADFNIEFEERITLPASCGVTVKVRCDRLGENGTHCLKAKRCFTMRQQRGGQQ